MTTAPEPASQANKPGYRTSTVGSVVRVALVCTFGIGLVAILLAAVVAGSPAAAGASIAVAMVCLFFAVGAAVLDVVSSLAPSASLLIALLTYTLKIVLVGLVFLSLQTSGALDGPVDAQWLGGTVITCTLTWMVAQIVASMRARQLAYDLPSPAEEASV